MCVLLPCLRVLIFTPIQSLTFRLSTQTDNLLGLWDTHAYVHTHTGDSRHSQWPCSVCIGSATSDPHPECVVQHSVSNSPLATLMALWSVSVGCLCSTNLQLIVEFDPELSGLCRILTRQTIDPCCGICVLSDFFVLWPPHWPIQRELRSESVCSLKPESGRHLTGITNMNQK